MKDHGADGATAAIDPKALIWGDKAEAIEKALIELDEDLAELVIGVAYDRVFARSGLDLKTRELLAIAHLMSVGGESELETHIRGARNCGADFQEIKETILHAAMFLGFPKAITAMKVLKRVWVKTPSQD